MSPSRGVTVTMTSLLRGGGVLVRIATVATAICLLVVGLSAASDGEAAIRRGTNIPAQGLRSALQMLSKERDFQVVFRTDLVGDARTSGAAGDLTLDEALKQLLTGTGLTYRYLDDKTVTILPVKSPEPDGASTKAQVEGSGGATSADKEGKKSSSGGFRVAQVDQGASSGSAPVERQNQQASKEKPVLLEEVLVTAQKREERLQDVPVPVTAISADTLLNNNQLRLQDYYTSIPGLSVTASGAGNSILTIRGISTGGQGYANPTVGITVDDAPFGPSSYIAASFAGAPDIDPSDLKQVEVLRGPQGTLYGVGSMGGLVKFVTLDPSPDGMSGRVQASTSSVHNGAELGYGVRGSVNVPLSDEIAIRASAFTRRDPGYIDDPALGTEGVNRARTDGGRISALWRLSSDWSLKLNALVQKTTADGDSFVTPHPGLGDLQQLQLRGTGSYRRDVSNYSANVKGVIGGVNLTSISSYGIDKYSQVADGTPFYSSAAIATFGVPGVSSPGLVQTKKFTEEIRISRSIGQRVDWLFGAFYTHEDNSPTDALNLAADPATGAVVGLGFHDVFPTAYAEYAAFGDLTVHVTDRFDVQLGGREGQNRQRYEESITGPFIPLVFVGAPSSVYNPPVHTKDNSFTYLLTPSFKFSPNLMVYARLASGYRPGGPNSTCVVYNFPCKFAPDKTRNYEIGAKGEVFDHILSFDVSAYYIDWKDIQIQVVDPTSFSAFFTNGSGAKSQGLELSAQVKPFKSLTVAAWISLSDASLTADLPANGSAIGVSGDRLPYSSRLSGNIALEQEFPLTSSTRGFVGGSVSYVGDRKGEFVSVFSPGQPRIVLPSYVEADLHVGVRYESWALNAFLNNLADRRGILNISPYTAAINYIQPRTVGASLSKSF